MRILVTGGAGFIGSHLSHRFVAQGHQVVVADDLSTGFRNNVPAKAEFIKLDLSRESSVEQLPPGAYDAVCHLAGQSSGEKSFDDPLYDLDANARSTLLLTRWALRNRVPTFLYASSMGVYGQVARPPASESVVPQPISFYGASKRSAELILKVAAGQGLRTVSFRMFSIYGPGQNMNNMKQGMVSIYLAYMLKQEPVQVKGPLERVRDHLNVADAVSAWELALHKPVSGIFNLGSGVGTKVGVLLDELLSACGLDKKTYPVQELPGTAGDQFALWADISAARQALGWTPTITLHNGLAGMVAWARQKLSEMQ